MIKLVTQVLQTTSECLFLYYYNVFFYLHMLNFAVALFLIIAAGGALTRADKWAPSPSVSPGEGWTGLRLQPAQWKDKGRTIYTNCGPRLSCWERRHQAWRQTSGGTTLLNPWRKRVTPTPHFQCEYAELMPLWELNFRELMGKTIPPLPILTCPVHWFELWLD